MGARRLIVGTRGSGLAVAQTEAVIVALRAARPELDVAIVTIRTTADRFPDEGLDRLPGVGFFVKELETALLQGRVDVAVHSMKDLLVDFVDGRHVDGPHINGRHVDGRDAGEPQVDQDPAGPPGDGPAGGLQIAAVPAREDARDVLVTRSGGGLQELRHGARVGTSSPRRAAFLRAARPDLTVVPMRGNVETRLRKLDAGEVDAVCLALAGLRRLGLDGRVAEILPVHVMVPAAGQGALGVQVRAGDEVAALVRVLDHPPTRAAVDAERAVLGRLQGGCRLPVGVHAAVTEHMVSIEAAVVAPDGGRSVRGTRTGEVSSAAALGCELADDLLRRGADALLPLEGAPR